MQLILRLSIDCLLSTKELFYWKASTFVSKKWLFNNIHWNTFYEIKFVFRVKLLIYSFCNHQWNCSLIWNHYKWIVDTQQNNHFIEICIHVYRKNDCSTTDTVIQCMLHSLFYMQNCWYKASVTITGITVLYEIIIFELLTVNKKLLYLNTHTFVSKKWLLTNRHCNTLYVQTTCGIIGIRLLFSSIELKFNLISFSTNCLQ